MLNEFNKIVPNDKFKDATKQYKILIARGTYKNRASFNRVLT